MAGRRTRRKKAVGGRRTSSRRGSRENAQGEAVGREVRAEPVPLVAWLLPLGSGRRKLWTLAHTRSALEQLFGEDLHLARVRSLANAVAGVLNASMVSIGAIGRKPTRTGEDPSKSGVKQVDRMLGNDALSLDLVLARLDPARRRRDVDHRARDGLDRLRRATTTRRSAPIW